MNEIPESIKFNNNINNIGTVAIAKNGKKKKNMKSFQYIYIYVYLDFHPHTFQYNKVKYHFHCRIASAAHTYDGYIFYSIHFILLIVCQLTIIQILLLLLLLIINMYMTTYGMYKNEWELTNRLWFSALFEWWWSWKFRLFPMLFLFVGWNLFFFFPRTICFSSFFFVQMYDWGHSIHLCSWPSERECVCMCVCVFLTLFLHLQKSLFFIVCVPFCFICIWCREYE